MVKLSIFGLCRDRGFEDTTSSSLQSLRWISPEVFLSEATSDKSDIYSFGILLSEIDTRKVPFADARTPDGHVLGHVQVANEVAKGILLPTFTSECPSSIQQLALSCLARDPNNRPTSTVILDLLQDIVFQDIEDLQHKNHHNPYRTTSSTIPLENIVAM